jgi:transcriptional regulator GlxA family with amidase domain
MRAEGKVSNAAGRRRSVRSPAPPKGLRERSVPPPYVVGFYLVPAFPMMAFAAAIEPLRSANRLRGQRLYDWRLYSRNGEPVPASNGVDIAVHAPLDDSAVVDLLIVCAGTRNAGVRDPVLVRWLRAGARRGVAVGGISLGAYALARAGVLDGRRCALHWESLADFAEEFPRIRATSQIFCVDGNRRTCGGGTAALDMMLHLITEREGRALAHDVSEQFIHPRIRSTQDPQRMTTRTRLGVANEKLIAAIERMEAAGEEPRPVRSIAEEVSLSPRQLERLFAKYLRTSPSRYGLRLRLARARTLLLETTRPILDVAVACGFVSASHFSRCYRAAYGRRPSDERTRPVQSFPA